MLAHLAELVGACEDGGPLRPRERHAHVVLAGHPLRHLSLQHQSKGGQDEVCNVANTDGSTKMYAMEVRYTYTC